MNFALKVGRLLTCLGISGTLKKNAKSGDFAEPVSGITTV
jgi:hypothetical protein